MKIATWTVIAIAAVAAMYWHHAHAPWAPWWVDVGSGLGAGSALHVLITAIYESREPKPPKKSFPTTPR